MVAVVEKIQKINLVGTFSRGFLVAIAVFSFSQPIWSVPIDIALSKNAGAESSLNLGSLLHYASGLVGKLAEGSKGDAVATISKRDVKDDLYILKMSFNSMTPANLAFSGQSFHPNEDDEDNSPPTVDGEALCYPNPFRQSSLSGGKIGYRLTNSGEIQLQVYDMMARKVIQRTYPKGAPGGQRGYNKIMINQDTFDGHLVSAGVYFYLLMHNGEVLAKGKMAVKP
ncbi:MAG: hypothetical protein ACI9BD_000971 [Candidatus Marinamargulisbacteria bacterium]|jgi:hypothetical protein